jgi:acyl phosphate:glycerol-3-phosphate acyltransferase
VSERPDGFFEPLTRKEWQAEARRKAIHLSFLVLPLVLLLEPLPWPHSRGQFRILFLTLTATAIALDVLRIHERRVRTIFRRFFGELIRQHEALSLLGSTYLLLAALIAIEVFPQPIAAVALGFTVLGDAASALVGRAWGRHKLFGKSWEGTLGCLVTCLAWAACVTHAAGLPLQITVAGALVATLVEVLPIPLDDNLGITLAAGYTMKLMAG